MLLSNADLNGSSVVFLNSSPTRWRLMRIVATSVGWAYVNQSTARILFGGRNAYLPILYPGQTFD